MKEDIYQFLIDEEEFQKMLDGKKTIHLVVNSSKYKVLSVGNQISFVKKQPEAEQASEKVFKVAVIENLLYFNDVNEAVGTLGKEKCGFKPSATFEKATDLFLSSDSFEPVEKYGIVAIVFKILD